MACTTMLLAGCKQDNWMDWKLQNELWLEQNAKQEGIQTTASGLQYKVIYPGNTSDTRPNTGGTVVITYKGSLINGKQFDSATDASFICASSASTETLSLTGGIIAGMAEGLRKMDKHADFILYIPWELGYGEKGTGTEGYQSHIPPYSTLIFEIHLTDVIN